MSASNNRSSPSNRSNENHVFYLDGRLSASPDSCESHLYQNPSCSNQPTSQSQHNRSANSGSPTSDVGNRSLLESTGDWSPLVRNANSHTADATGYSYSPSQHRYANKDYSLPTRKPELYAFFENPLTKTVEKLSKLTDFVVADRRTGQPKHRSYGFSSFVSPFEEQAPNGSGHQFHLNTEEQHLIGIPPPSLPHIESTRQVQRKPPITQEQFDETLSKLNKRELLNEIFYSVRDRVQYFTC